MNSPLTRLLKAKNYEKMSLDELIDEYIALYAKNAQSNFDELLSELMIFLQKYQSVSPATVETLFVNKIQNYSALPSSAVLIPLIYEKSLFEGMPTPKVSIQFGGANEDAIKMLEERMLWVGNDSSKRTERALRELFKDAYSGKYTHDEMMQSMRDNFTQYADMEVSKLKAAVDFNLTQGHNLAVVARAIARGDKYVQAIATLDSKTTNVCRSMHKRYIKVSSLKSQYGAILNATTTEEAKFSSDLSFSQTGMWNRSMPSNFGIPPYHFKCRTVLINVSNANHQEPVVDEFGREYEIKDKETYDKIRTKKDHLSASKAKSVEDLAKETFGSIAKEGTHVSDGTKRVIWGSNGFMGILDKNGKIETLYKPVRGIGDFYQTTSSVYYDKLEQSFKQRVKKWLGL